MSRPSEPARWWVLVLGAVGGLATDAGFPGRGWWGAAFVGMAPLFAALRRDSARSYTRLRERVRPFSSAVDRATVQISTVGVSAVIAPSGVVTEQTGLFTAEQMVDTVPLRTSLTPAAAMGVWPAWAISVLAVVVVAAGIVGAARQRRGHRPPAAP